MNKARIHLIGLLVTSLAAVAVYLFSVRPVIQSEKSMAKAYAETDRLQRLVPRMQREIKAIETDLDSRLEALAARYFVRTVPDDPLLEVISKLLEAQSLELVNLHEHVDSKLGQTAVEMRVQGAYVDIVQLLGTLRSLDRPVALKSLQLAPAEKTGKECLANLKLVFSQSASLGPELAARRKYD